tara:strand:- start:379 stop:981 length:603 start_codon:yes stop_codon:yes gene_type:complete
MKKTPQEFKRDSVKQLFEKVLQSQAVKLSPLTINVGESWKSDFTSVNLSCELTKSENVEILNGQEELAKGFVDGIFKICFKIFSDENLSLSNIELCDYRVKPSFKKSETTSGFDAKVGVCVMMKVKDHGIAEFSSVSRSVLYSSYAAILEAFQFYVNCEKTFCKLQLILQDAKERNRGDIVQECLSDLSKLTEVNTYGKE